MLSALFIERLSFAPSTCAEGVLPKKAIESAAKAIFKIQRGQFALYLVITQLI